MSVRIVTKVSARSQALAVCEGHSLPSSISDELSRQWDHGRIACTATLGRTKHGIVLGVRTKKHRKREPLTWSSPDAVCRAFGALGRRIVAEKLRTVSVALPKDLSDDTAEPIVTGLTRGMYRFDRYKTSRTGPNPSVVIAAPNKSWAARAEHALIVADAIDLARDLVNTPASDMGPAELESAARDVAKAHGLKCRVLNAARCAKLGMGALTAVGRASDRPPRLIVLEYNGNPKSKKFLALAGKGICFDTGGLNIKIGNNMLLMKKDMGGAATVLGAAAAIGQLAPETNVRFYLAVAENSVAGNAMRPGDVLTAMDGTTIEIGNTDAEGRLVLADAVAYAVREGASRLVDVATLTGAAFVALARVRVPLMGSDELLLADLEAAAVAAGERVWRLPTDAAYRDMIKGSVADLSNIGAGGGAGTITAGLFIGHFAKKVPWAHLDISPASWSTTAHPLGPVGATGVMVPTLVKLACGEQD